MLSGRYEYMSIFVKDPTLSTVQVALSMAMGLSRNAHVKYSKTTCQILVFHLLDTFQ